AVVDDMERQGFIILEWNKQTQGPADVRVVKHGGSKDEDRKMILQIRAAIYPEDPPYLTQEEMVRLVQRANQLGDEPWEVRTYLDGTYRAVGPPQWRYLRS
ncbi:MAG: hypothetical protein ACYCW6_21890, partial [Candidatus Xenobia bacterium]